MSRFLLVVLLASAASAEGDKPRLEAFPREIVLRGAAAEHGLLVDRVADGKAVDVTRAAALSSSRPEVATAEGGRIRATADGEAEIRVTHDGLSATVKVRVEGAAGGRAPSFRHEVVPLLTRYGCNAGMCHGKESGQNGFKLSLRGFDPERDYERLTLESRGRRFNLAAPEASLFLAKAAGTVPHRGGGLFAPDSRPHRRLVDWLSAGAPGLAAADPVLESIELLGAGRVLRPGQEQPLLVLGRFSDGAVRDVTWLSQFFPNDATVLSAAPDGVVKARREGASSVRAHFQDKVAVASFAIPREGAVDKALFAARANEIDRHVFGQLEALRIPPSGPCSDETFLRRVYFDAIGTAPTAAEIRAFLADPAPGKREKAVDALLSRPEFVDYWALLLGDLLQNRKERDHDVRGAKGVRAFHEWLRGQVAANRPWDALARDVLLATGDSFEKPQIGYFVVNVGEQRQAEMSDVTVGVAQSFLGTRILCAKCHNHPDERYTQDDYYHFAAFFSRISLDRQKPEKGGTTLAVMSAEERDARKRIGELEKEAAKLKDGELEKKTKQIADERKRMEDARKKPVRISQPRTKAPMEPRPLDRSATPIGEDPRQALVDWMTSPENEYFSGNIVNRIWKHYMGAGLVEPVDDLRPSNPPTNRALWDHLRGELVKGGWDLRRLMRHILTSRAYALSSETAPGNENDRRFHSRYFARRLPAEALLDAVSAATGVPDAFPGQPLGVRAIQVADPGLDSYFLELFGKSDRVTACACEREGEVTLPQLLHMQNGDSVVRKIGAPDGRLAALLKEKDDAKVAEELFLATLSRLPRDAEKKAVAKALAMGDRAEAFRDLFWALLNSKEFVFNH
ncbi:MAG TPA: DUF1549 and DUF1553 domain-containing protein [Planctomycetota bacterium]